MLSQRAERFIRKNEEAGRQAPWISFKAIAEHCAALRTPRKPAAGQPGKGFAYDELIKAMARGAFGVNQRSRVLLLISHEGKVLSVTANELLEAREAFDQITFETGYLEHCWAPAGLVAAWFRQTGVPAPWGLDARPTLHVPRKRPYGAIDHERDVEIIDNAIEKKVRQGLRWREAVRGALSDFGRADRDLTGSETDRLRTRMRQRQRLRKINKDQAITTSGDQKVEVEERRYTLYSPTDADPRTLERPPTTK
jgi:hypothetical protein